MDTTVITGANRGIGLELCAQSAARGDSVIAVCRQPSSALERLGVRVESAVDVTSAGDVSRLADRLQDVAVNRLINNAGMLGNETLEALDFDAIRRQFEVNSLGPLRVSAALAPRLVEGAKVAFITSRMGSIADNTSGGRYGYRMSKAALNMAGASLAHDLRPRGISVILLHPGYVATDMTGHAGDVSPEAAARGLLAQIDALTLETSGTFKHANGRSLPW